MEIRILKGNIPTDFTTLADNDPYTEIAKLEEKLFAIKRPLMAWNQELVAAFQTEYPSLNDHTYFIELNLESEQVGPLQILSRFQKILPQFAFFQIAEKITDALKSSYCFAFLPIFWQDEEQPLAIDFETSVRQQLPYPKGYVQERLIQRLHYDIVSNGLLHEVKSVVNETVAKKEEAPVSVAPASEPIASNKIIELPASPEKIKQPRREKESDPLSDLEKENERLTLTIAKIERELMYDGLATLELPKPDKQLDKRIKIPLLEYDQLLEKGRKLEYVWRQNKDLVDDEAIRVADIDYPAAKIQQVKGQLDPAAIYLFMGELGNIEKRTKVKRRRGLRKPYAKIIKRDYEELLSKAAYFNLLQGESFLHYQRRKTHTKSRSTENHSAKQEDG